MWGKVPVRTISKRTISKRAVRRRVIRLLRDLGMAPPIDVEELCRRLGDYRGRPIELFPHHFPVARVFGLWVATSTADRIYYEVHTTTDHYRHIVLHEIAHIVLDHPSENLSDDVWEQLTLSLPPDVHRLMRRSSYDTPWEREAETFATAASEWNNSMGLLDTPTASEIERAFDDPKGWL